MVGTLTQDLAALQNISLNRVKIISTNFPGWSKFVIAKRNFQDGVEMLDCLFQTINQGEEAEEEEDTRHVHDVATATNPVASHGETGK